MDVNSSGAEGTAPIVNGAQIRGKYDITRRTNRFESMTLIITNGRYRNSIRGLLRAPRQLTITGPALPICLNTMLATSAFPCANGSPIRWSIVAKHYDQVPGIFWARGEASAPFPAYDREAKGMLHQIQLRRSTVIRSSYERSCGHMSRSKPNRPSPFVNSIQRRHLVQCIRNRHWFHPSLPTATTI